MTVGRYCNGGKMSANQSAKSAGNAHNLFKPDPTHAGAYYNGGESHANRAGKGDAGRRRKFRATPVATEYHSGGSYQAR